MKQGAKSMLIILAFLTLLLAGTANGQAIPVEWGQYSDWDMEAAIEEFIDSLDSGMDFVDLALALAILDEFTDCYNRCYGFDTNPPGGSSPFDRCMGRCLTRLIQAFRDLDYYKSGPTLGLLCQDDDGDGQCDEGSSGVKFGFLADNDKSGNETEVRAWSTVKSMYR